MRVEKYNYEDLEKDIKAQYSSIIESRKHQAFRNYRDELDRCFMWEIPSIIQAISPLVEELNTLALQPKMYEGPRKVWDAVLAIILAIVSLYFIFGLIQVLSSTARTSWGAWLLHGPYSLIGALAAFIVSILAYWRIRSIRSFYTDSVSISIFDAQAKIAQKRLVIVEETTTRVINKVLGPQGILRFPTEAPRLVELSTSKIIPSASTRFVKDFIESHESSAIGISGPRGSGKTTLIKAVCTDKDLKPFYVEQSAPVRYDSADFIRRLTINICLKISNGKIGGHSKTRLRQHQQQRLLMRLQVVVIGLTLGVSLIAADIINISQKPPFNQIGTFGWTGIGIIALTLGTIFCESINRTAYRERLLHSAGPKTTFYATEKAQILHKRVTHELERGATNKGVLSFLNGSIGVEREESSLQKERVLSSADMVSELRGLLESFAVQKADSASGDAAPVLIVIDELDKISEPADLVSTINDLKDLFHIPGVHFLVSVSTDALRSFEQRGLPARDAFDSSFDAIIGVQPLMLEESLRVIAARAEGFPPLVGAFCHAWSGGLPRELLRVARRCVQLQRESPSALSIETIVGTVMAEDIVTAVEARLRTILPEVDGSHSDELTRRALWEIRQRGRKLMQSETIKLPNVQTYPKLDALSMMVLMAEGLMHYYSSVESGSPASWSAPELDNTALDAVAKVIASRGDPIELRNEAVEAALTRLGALSATERIVSER